MKRPCSSTAVVPATTTRGPARTALEYPTIGSHFTPDEMFWRSMPFRLRTTMVGPVKNSRMDLTTVGGPQELRELLGGLIRELRGRLPARQVPPVPFLEVTDDPEEVRLEAVM